MRDAGVNTTPAAGLTEKFLISQKKKGDDADNVRAIKTEAIALADEIEGLIQLVGGRILAGEEPEDPDLV